MDYRFVIHSDITDCYGSIYTHSISWALHTKKEAKKRENRNNNSFIGVVIDKHLQDMSHGQTNGIPQGSTLMDFISEIVLGYVDLLLAEKLSVLDIEDYKILRYRDDYRIFTKESYEAERITKELSEILSNLGLRLNPDKTRASDDIVKSSIKPDKRYWISNRRIAENKQKWLIQLYLLSERYPNSGTIDTQMREFLKVLKKSKKKDRNLETLISLVTEIALRNPRVTPSAIAILSIFINRLPNKKEKLKIAKKIRQKFNQVPNSSFMMVWFQRLNLKINKTEKYKLPLCKKVGGSKEKIWNCEWLEGDLKKVIDEATIVEESKIKKARSKLAEKEIDKIITKKNYYN
ncbi:RNA-directed DNA polymerase [Fodinibius sediminis]|uniref:Reverse transcriptase (RNA-dependent DNA polymerase) n=1 Tax=Fodinibius sediminis TaxID=1214077 RepID=A0A521FHH8_9BACT|nr:RNA-directed DNA polymerase [Fodinibius sediminis]SMO95678.1 Reverse transcriptase (RNA-dependent DNA polymerase) [Fodinibius sediminis]